ncbi:MAG: endonuclease/exonuclease/phosphatase family protein [Deltaproteobacteria bacterium]|nr:endonuclease/exonuclease/phosphatase family protein [Deltaproteobacteria bacterium]
MLLKILNWLLVLILLLVSTGILFVWFITWHPAALEESRVYNSPSLPRLQAGQTIKIMSWNVQYLAGKNYVFFYDLLDDSGPDERPSSEDIEHTLHKVVKTIKNENPDVIMLQELDDDAGRTDRENQVARLLGLLPDEYGAHTSVWYWKSLFVPHSRIMSAVGMKLTVISKYQLKSSRRHALPLIPGSWLVQQFNLKRALQEVILPVGERDELILINTHLDAFAQGTNTMEKQVDKIRRLLKELSNAEKKWLIAGDFNLLPDKKAFERLPEKQRAYFKPNTELNKLSGKYPRIPSPQDVQGKNYQKWFTHFPNDPEVKSPDRTIDYFFVSPLLEVLNYQVRHKHTLDISDHLPLIVEVKI